MTHACSVFLLFGGPSYDPNRVEPRLGALAMPYQSVNVGINGPFGGEVWLRSLDRDGHQLRMALPASFQAGTTKTVYTRLVLGSERSGDTNAVEVSLSDRAFPRASAIGFP